MNKEINQNKWDHLKHQLYESHIDQLGNSATCWQDFHLASMICSTDKNSLAGFRIGLENIIKFQNSVIHDSFRTLKLIPLLDPKDINETVSQAILQRRSCRENMIIEPLSYQDLSDLLYYGYGQSPNGLRNVPSGGALYPLDVYVYCSNVESVEEGLYYYSPEEHGIKRISEKKDRSNFESFFSEQVYQFVKNASAYIFITASFLKTVWKYSERGYRFTLLEIGHVAQNLNLISSSKKLACVNVGGFFDWETNEFLGLDGLLDANMYMVCVGHVNP